MRLLKNPQYLLLTIFSQNTCIGFDVFVFETFDKGIMPMSDVIMHIGQNLSPERRLLNLFMNRSEYGRKGHKQHGSLMFTVMLIQVCSLIPKKYNFHYNLRNVLSLVMDLSNDQVLLRDITFHTHFPNLSSTGILIPYLNGC